MSHHHHLKNHEQDMLGTGGEVSTCIYQLWADTGCSLEELPGVMDDRNGWWERESRDYVISLTWWWNHHHHHVVPQQYPWPSLATFPYRSSPLAGLQGLHSVSSHSCWMYVRAGRPAFARPYVGVNKSTSLMSSSLLLQQCPACLVCQTWIVFVIGGRWL